MKIRQYILSILCLLLFSGPVDAQHHPGLMRYAGNIMQFDSICPQEKVYLHFDNTGYFEGETIWYKAYVVNASSLQRPKSSVLYVELVSPTGVILQQKKLKIIDGQTDGCFVLYDVSTQQSRSMRGILPYPSGYYEIRAYTQYMLNFDDNVIFSRVFPIFQKPKDEGQYNESVFVVEPSAVGNERPKSEQYAGVKVSLYPEGGHIVSGLPTNIAFKAIDSSGCNVNGTLLIDGEIEEVAVKSSVQHDGMGTIRITPKSSRNINARFIYQGEEYKVELPSVEKSGYTMLLSDNYAKEHLVLGLHRNVDELEHTLGVTVTCRGKLIHHSQLVMQDSVKNYNHCISTIGWPLGVCHIVVYNSEGNVLLSRNMFHYNSEFTSPSINIEEFNTDFSPFSKINLSLQLKDKDGTPFRDRIALSVRDSQEYGTIYSDNLLTNLLLSSDLKGFINNPEYYMESDDSLHRSHTDLLMLVQGWERYEWRYMSGVETFKIKNRLETNLSVNGWALKNTLSTIKRDVFLSDVDVYVTIAPSDKNLNIEYGKYTTDSTGYFGFNTQDFYGVADLSINLVQKSNALSNSKNRSKVRHDSKAKIRLERAYTPPLRPISGIETLLSKNTYNIKLLDREERDSFPTYYGKDKSILLPRVDINAEKRYIDYNTFQAFNVKKDVEKLLDLGEYPTTVYGYLIDKGYNLTSENRYSEPFYSGLQDHGINIRQRTNYTAPFTINGFPVFMYFHTQNKMIENDVSFYMNDISNIKSINVSENTIPMYAIMNEIPLFFKTRSYKFNPELSFQMNSNNRRYYLLDVLVEEDHKLAIRSIDKKNLGIRFTTLWGFYPPDQFYAPEYPDGPIPGDVDYRRTLYWNPNLVTDSVGRAQVEFYNNSYSTAFSISGAGMTASGTPYIIDETYTKPED